MPTPRPCTVFRDHVCASPTVIDVRSCVWDKAVVVDAEVAGCAAKLPEQPLGRPGICPFDDVQLPRPREFLEFGRQLRAGTSVTMTAGGLQRSALERRVTSSSDLYCFACERSWPGRPCSRCECPAARTRFGASPMTRKCGNSERELEAPYAFRLTFAGRTKAISRLTKANRRPSPAFCSVTL